MTQSRQVPQGLLVAVALVALIWAAKAAEALFVPLLLAATLAFMAAPIVRALERRKLPQWLAVSIASGVLVTPLALVAVGTVYQLQSLAADYPRIMAFVDAKLARLATTEWGMRFGLSRRLTTLDVVSQLSDRANAGIEWAATGFQALVSASSAAVIIVIFAIAMLASRRHLLACSQRILNNWEGVQTDRLLQVTTTLVERFLLMKLVIAALIGGVSGLALWACDIPYSYLLGAVFGIATVIPTVGFVMALVPFAIVALATDAHAGQFTLAFGLIFAVHIVEANAITPKLLGKTLNLNALTTLFGLFAGGLLWGVWGMFLSVPILGVMRILFSISPRLVPWGELLAEREDRELVATLVTRRLRGALRRAGRTQPPPVVREASRA